jgi:hypothetical protein
VNNNIEKNIYKKRTQKKLLILHIFDYHIGPWNSVVAGSAVAEQGT